MAHTWTYKVCRIIAFYGYIMAIILPCLGRLGMPEFIWLHCSGLRQPIGWEIWIGLEGTADSSEFEGAGKGYAFAAFWGLPVERQREYGSP